MITKQTDYLPTYYNIKKERALVNLNFIDKIAQNEITLDDVNSKISFTISGLPEHFSLIEVEREIRKNVLEIKERDSLLKYFYYLIRIQWRLKKISLGINEGINYLKNRYNEIDSEIEIYQKKYNSFSELIFHCYGELKQISNCATNFISIIENEFSQNTKEWKGLFENRNEMPLLSEIEAIFIKEDQSHLPPNNELIKTKNPKLKWMGKPSQFGFIIDLLIQGGYLEKPTSSFSKDANLYLQHFDIDTTEATLAKELSEGSNNLATKNRKKIIIPHKDKLD